MKKFLYVVVTAFITACNNSDGISPDSTPIARDAPKSIGYSILNTYQHDTSSFTQGLAISDGNLYEGTGEYGHSNLLKVDLTTGKILKKVGLDKKYFGEGIAILRDTIYQLTWQEKVVFVYTLKDLKKVREFGIDTQGWGITTNGEELIVSDGTSNLYYYKPSSFQLLRTQSITEGGSLSYNLNELEYIDGYIYANQWQAPYILKIDPGSGSIIGKVDVTNIWNRVKAKDPVADVPNGIAYDSATKLLPELKRRSRQLYNLASFSNSGICVY